MPASRRRRAFGQHFLRDAKIIQTIVDLAYEEVARTEAKTLLEIGPGRGAITHPLLERAKFATPGAPGLEKFWIVEKDRNLADFWWHQAKERAPSPIEVLSEDFLNVDLTKLLAQAPAVVVSNLPYSAGTAILTMLAARGDAIPAMVLMFQAEVAHRLRAEPEEKAWGSLSIWIQNFWDVTKVVAVPPGAFEPPPDVNSEVVLLRPRAQPRIAGSRNQGPLLEKLLKVSFAHRRKMLRSGLPKGSPYVESLSKTSIEPTRRAESLTWDEWSEWFSTLLDSTQSV